MTTPALGRRLACFVYEGVLLFGVIMTAGIAYGVVTQQRHALVGTLGLRVTLFLVLALYFGWFWTRSGQTLAMQTWHIRLVTLKGRAVGWPRALIRYLLSWLWFVPALAMLYFWGLKGAWPAFAALTAGVLAYAGLSRLHPDRQYWHDAACRTRLVNWLPAAKQASK
jgi:uncharacterized RDD family membrane protein YckC